MTPNRTYICTNQERQVKFAPPPPLNARTFLLTSIPCTVPHQRRLASSGRRIPTTSSSLMRSVTSTTVMALPSLPAFTGLPALSPRQKICSPLVGNSLQANGEKQALLAMRKGQTIGQLCRDPTAALATKKSPIGPLENRLQPQATNAQQSFVSSIFTIHLLSMPVMNTTAPQMRNPPGGQIHHE